MLYSSHICESQLLFAQVLRMTEGRQAEITAGKGRVPHGGQKLSAVAQQVGVRACAYGYVPTPSSQLSLLAARRGSSLLTTPLLRAGSTQRYLEPDIALSAGSSSLTDGASSTLSATREARIAHKSFITKSAFLNDHPTVRLSVFCFATALNECFLRNGRLLRTVCFHCLGKRKRAPLGSDPAEE